MLQKDALLDLVVQWEELRDAGREVSPEELCRDCPEYVDAIRDRLQALKEIAEVLNTNLYGAPSSSSSKTAQKSSPQPFESSKSSTPVDFAVQRESKALRWPTIAGYEILKPLNHGGMGMVYKARQIGLDRIVAIKTVFPNGPIREEDVARFIREAKVMALLQHPNIVQIHEIGEHDGHPYLVMEYVSGGTLAEYLQGKPMPPRKAAELTAVLARAIDTAHQQGVIHRDLKPSNVLMTPSGTPKIADFGIAKYCEVASSYTQTGQLLGTPSYMAPEQLGDGSNKVGPLVDIYALGATLYELITGRPPFLAANPLDTLQLVRTQEPISLQRWQPKTPKDLDTICLKCLEKDPQKRYVSALALAEDLECFLEGKPIIARPIGVGERSWRWSRRHPAAAILMMATLFAVVMFMAMVLMFNRRIATELIQVNREHQLALSTKAKLDRALTDEVAQRLDSDLRVIASVPLTIAAMLEEQSVWDEAFVEKMLQESLRKSPLIFGLGVSMEPYAWQADRRDFALYVHRRQGTFATRQLLPPSYEPIYREREWYKDVLETGRERWGEPYVGEGGDRTPMVTFSVPIRREGRFIGVATADLAVDYFHSMRDSIDKLDLGPDSYCVVVSSDGAILSHPQDEFEYPSSKSKLSDLHFDPSVCRLIQQMPTKGHGEIQAWDPVGNAQATFLLSSVPSAHWTFFIVKHGGEETRQPSP